MHNKFEWYLDYLDIDKGVAESTLKKRERELRNFSEWLQAEQGTEDPEEVERRDISNFVDYLIDEGYSQHSILEGYYTTISAAFNQLYVDREIESNPVDRIRREAIKTKVRRAMDDTEKKAEHGPKDHITKQQVYELADHVPDPEDRNELLIKLLFWTGCRVSEILGVEIGRDGTLDGEGSDIDPSKPAITVYSPKTDEPRVVSYPPQEINPLLRDWVNHGRLRYKCADDTRKLFIGLQGAIGKRNVEKVVYKAADEMGIQKETGETKHGLTQRRVTPHLLRHSHAMHYHNEEDVPLDYIKDHLGHWSVETTEEFYAEGTEEKMIDTFGG